MIGVALIEHIVIAEHQRAGLAVASVEQFPDGGDASTLVFRLHGQTGQAL